MKFTAAVLGVVLAMGLAVSASAQTPPRLVRFSGVVRPAEVAPTAAGLPQPPPAPPQGAATLTFGVYADAEGGAALWTETQKVLLEPGGHFTVVLGVTQAEGVPLDVFTSVTARWLEVSGEGFAPMPRVLLVSVPYALKAADAETVGGKPLSAFVLAGEKTGTGSDGLNYVNTKLLTAGGAAPTGGASAGTANYLAMFTDSTNVGNSVMYQNGTSIGIGTTAPAAPFHSAAGSSPGAYFDVYSNNLTALPVVFRAARGTALAPTAVQTDDILGGMAVRGYGASAWSTGRGQVMFKAAENWTNTANGTYLMFTTTPLGSVGWTERMRITPAGFVGIGTTAPTAMLHVAGDAVVDGNLAAKYQDVAEWVESGEVLTPGTVVVVDAASHNAVKASSKAYDVTVAGAVSAQPGLILGEKSATKSLVAQSGRVRIKVDASYGAVKAGDLLVTSPTAGYAMVSKPVKVQGAEMHRPGTILGKALESLPSGKGEILVLLTLQ